LYYIYYVMKKELNSITVIVQKKTKIYIFNKNRTVPFFSFFTQQEINL